MKALALTCLILNSYTIYAYAYIQNEQTNSSLEEEHFEAAKRCELMERTSRYKSEKSDIALLWINIQINNNHTQVNNYFFYMYSMHQKKMYWRALNEKCEFVGYPSLIYVISEKALSFVPDLFSQPESEPETHQAKILSYRMIDSRAFGLVQRVAYLRHLNQVTGSTRAF